MLTLQKTTALDRDYLESLGFVWHTDSDETSYISDELVVISETEAEAYYEATNELYDMYVEAAEHVIENNLFHEIGIPFNLIDAIKESWENDVHWHLYGRFDLAGGIDNKPIKLLEFNADTPTANWDLTITDEDGVDILEGEGANRDPAGAGTSEGYAFTISELIASKLTFTVANAGNAKKGVVKLYLT